MPITFLCPNCKKSLTVADQMVGKKGTCRNCKTSLTVPMPTTTAADKRAAPPADVEAAAAALLADLPQPAAPVDDRTVAFTCPYCDAQVQLSTEVAGKRAPCPECRRIVKVPDLTLRKPKDWRRMDDGLPLGARRPDQPAPEGAWGSTGARAVSAQALVQARAIPQARPPMSTRRKVLLGVAAVGVLCLAGGGSLVGYKWLARNREQQALQSTLAYTASESAKTQVGREGIAALHCLAGEYYLTTNRPGSAALAREQLEKALGLLTSPGENERDEVLLDLSLGVTDLGGDATEADSGTRLKWDEVHKMLRATLGAIRTPEVRLEALRQVSRRLIARGQPDRPEALATAVFAASPAEKAEALAVVGLELLVANQKPRAEKAASQALQTYAGEPGAVPLSAAVVALAVALNQPIPKSEKDPGAEAAVVRGKAEGLARLGQWEAARHQALSGPNAEAKVLGLLAVAAVALDAKTGSAQDAESAVQLAETTLKNRRDVGGLLRWLVQVAAQAGVSPDKLQAVASGIPEVDWRGRAQLAIFRARLNQGKQVLEESAAGGVDPKSLSHQLARAYLARHNVRQSGDWVKVVQGWSDPSRTFGLAGVALALAGKE